MPANICACHFSAVIMGVLLKWGWKIGPVSITCMNDVRENWQVIKRPCSPFNSPPSSLWIITFCLVSGMIMEIEKLFLSASYLKDEWGTYNWLKLSFSSELWWCRGIFFLSSAWSPETHWMAGVFPWLFSVPYVHMVSPKQCTYWGQKYFNFFSQKNQL